MQNVQQEVEHDNRRRGFGIEEIKRAGENREGDIGPEEHFQFTPAVGQDLRQHASEHHPDDAKADKQRRKVSALPHDPSDVIHRRRHADKARADVAQRQQ